MTVIFLLHFIYFYSKHYVLALPVCGQRSQQQSFPWVGHIFKKNIDIFNLAIMQKVKICSFNPPFDVIIYYLCSFHLKWT